MAKQLNVNLAFTADTSKAKQSIMDLQQSLTKIVASSTINIDDNKLRQVSNAAQELSIHLNNAFNVDTGKLDLSKLSKSLKSSSASMTDLSSKLLQAGADGQVAFVKLAQSVAAADRPAVTLNSKLSEMLTTLKNTARWQISSSILHGFMGAIQSAYGYVQDLNESLNDIRIVTGQNTTQMNKFAEQANKAAKALSTTTLEYTNASLIYYQQGLSDAEVADRTAITIKMANAAGQSAEIVSDQLTAVWNNFYDGSQSLEHYADVMTALGAATASSTDEISEGLNKFASIAETVGLSYEYAASALATVTATTRQSADVVGTAFKTLFARLQDLELGETLDDGTTLGKYSAALNSVGINIKDVNGNMKDMDQILDELGNKWQSLSKDTQVALAQTVAGTRQYTQLVALMDNWSYFQENLGIAKDSEGSLQAQADIYAESWEAARDRVRASLESIYDQLLDDQFFIDLNNGFASLLNSIGAFIDGVGGIKTILIGVGSVFLSSIAHKIQPALKELGHNFTIVFSTAEQKATALANEMNETIVKALSSTDYNFNDANQNALKDAMTLNSAKAKLQAIEEALTNEERQQAEQQLALIQMQQQENQALAESIEKKKEAIDLIKEEIDLKSKNLIESSSSGKAFEITGKSRDQEEQNLINAKNEANATFLASRTNENKQALEAAKAALNDHRMATEEASLASEKFATRLADVYSQQMAATDGHIAESTAVANVADILTPYEEKLNKIAQAYNNHKSSIPDVQQKIALLGSEVKSVVGDSLPELDQALDDIASASGKTELNIAIEHLRESLVHANIPAKDLEKVLTKLGQGKGVKALKADYEKLEQETKSLSKATQQLLDKQKALKGLVEKFNPTHMVTGLEKIAKAGAGLGKVAMLAQSVRSVLQAWSNDDLSFGEKLITTFLSLSMIIPSLTGAMQDLNTLTQINNMTLLGSLGAHQAKIKLLKDEATQNVIGAALKRASTSEDAKASATAAAKLAVQKGIIEADEQEAYANLILTATKKGENLEDQKALVTDGLIQMSKGKTIAVYWSEVKAKAASVLGTIASTVAKWGENSALWANVAAWLATQAAMAPVLVVTLLIVAAIAALVAIIWVVVAAFKAWQASTPEAKLKAAEEEAARLGEELTKAKDAANELRESIEAYDSAIEKIKTLKEGTEEWRQAIQEANDIAREMIDENEGLAGKYSFNADTGLIEFDEGALEDAQAGADNKVSMVQAHKIRADNAVLQAKSNVSIHNATEDNNKWYEGGTYEATQDTMETQALNKLIAAYKDNDGNYAKAIESLSGWDQNIIKSLGMTDTELQALCQEVKNNSDAMHENTKQLIHSTLENDYEYNTSEYKDFIADTMATDMDAEAERLYEEKYKDMMGGMSDAEIQKQYAEMMGWDANLVDNKSGNKAVYINDEGEEVTISDEQVRRALAQSEAQSTTTEQSDDYIQQANQLAEIEKKAMESIGGADGLSMSEYEDYVAEIKKQAADQGIEFSPEEIDKFINQYGSNQRVNSQIVLKDSLAALGDYDDAEMTQFVENISKDLTDEQLQIAVDVAASAKSVDDFARQFEQAATAAFIDSLNSSADQAKNLLTTSSESGTVDQDSLMALGEDKNFQAYLEEQGKTMVSLTAATYSEKMTIIADYYTKLKDMEADALEINKQNYQEDLATYEAILQYKQAYDAYQKNPTDKSALANMNELANTYKNIDFQAYMEMDTSEIHNKIDEIQKGIEDIEAQKVSLNMEWDTTDAIEASLKGVSNLSKALENDMVKVGNSYQMTAAQMKTWAKQYPELFSQAQVTSEGIMELDAAMVEEYIAGQEAQTKASIEKNIAVLEGNYAELEVEKQKLEAERQIAMGEVAIEAASATQLMNIKNKLTQYYIDCGYDEVAANNAALTQMGISQDEYNTKTAELTQRTAETQIDNANAGAEGSVQAFSTMGEKIKAIFTNLWDATKKLFSLDFDGAWDSLKKSWKAVWTEVDPNAFIKDTQNNLDDIQYNINVPIKYEPSAETPDVMSAVSEMYDNEMNAIDAQMENISAEIAYNKGLLAQDLADYGNTEIDTDSDNAKNIEDLTKIAERYHEITREIAHYERMLKRLSKAKDRAYGGKYLNMLNQEKKALEIQYEKQSDLLAIQQLYLASDRAAIQNSFNGAVFDAETNELINYTELMKAAAQELNQYKQAYNDSQSDSDKEALEWAEKQYEERIALLEQYEETLDDYNDQQDTILDISYEMQDLNFEEINTKLELSLELNDMELATVEYSLNKISDDFYKMAEAAALMVGNSFEDNTNQMSLYIQNLGAYGTNLESLEQAYKNNLISQADYVDGLKEAKDGILSNLESLQELDKSMTEYYGNTLNMAAEEIAKYTDRMDHQTAVLDHYSSLLEIMGKSNDYKSMGKVLEGKAQTLEDQAAVAKETMEMYQGQATDRLAEYQKALASGDEAAAELYLQQYEAALNAANEAEDAYLSKAEEWAEALKAVLENKLSEAGADLEKALTGGVSFDTLTTQMERANSLQEEYLTTTNKIYETNKMINTAQQAIDKTTNTVAKQKLKSFQEETAQLQNQGKLSQYELDIQQAKYDLLLAEIALEEAQQAKSTVRLQRDSEGNFGYVYTADASQVSDAEQKVADAQNALYNKGLEGANDYTQKYQETMQEMYDTLTDIQSKYLEGGFASEEEYHRAMEEAKEYYYQKLQDYSSLYQVALTADSRVVADAWSTDFADMTYNTDDWMTAVNGYVETVSGAFNEWSMQMDVVAQETGVSLDDLENNVKDVTDESQNLTQSLIGENGIISAMESQMDAVANVTSSYAILRESLQDTMAKYEELAKSVDDSMRKQQEAIEEAQQALNNYTNAANTTVGVKNSGTPPLNSGKGDDQGNKGSDNTNTATISWYATPDRSVSMGALTVTQGEVSVTQLPHSYGDDSKWCNYSLKTKGGATGYVDYKTYNTLKQKGFLGSFDTGGYTGDWGQGGKLAMLHEKELILNADDTTNFLASLEVLREIVNTINLHSLSAQLGGLLNSPGYINTDNSQTLEQQVHIEASFPGVTERSEIEEAFNNLINRASQYINRS